MSHDTVCACDNTKKNSAELASTQAVENKAATQSNANTCCAADNKASENFDEIIAAKDRKIAELEGRCERLENVLEKMQERMAWLELNLSDNNDYLNTMLNRVDKVERQIKYLASMQEAPAAVRPLSEETPPPHY